MNSPFKTDSSACTSVWLEEALERLVQVGLKLMKTNIPTEDVGEAMENQAIPVIQGILRTIRPEASQNIRGIDPREIWKAYWELRTDGGEYISIFELLGEINNNPPLAPVPA